MSCSGDFLLSCDSGNLTQDVIIQSHSRFRWCTTSPTQPARQQTTMVSNWPQEPDCLFLDVVHIMVSMVTAKLIIHISHNMISVLHHNPSYQISWMYHYKRHNEAVFGSKEHQRRHSKLGHSWLIAKLHRQNRKLFISKRPLRGKRDTQCVLNDCSYVCNYMSGCHEHIMFTSPP